MISIDNDTDHGYVGVWYLQNNHDVALHVYTRFSWRRKKKRTDAGIKDSLNIEEGGYLRDQSIVLMIMIGLTTIWWREVITTTTTGSLNITVKGTSSNRHTIYLIGRFLPPKPSLMYNS